MRVSAEWCAAFDGDADVPPLQHGELLGMRHKERQPLSSPGWQGVHSVPSPPSASRYVPGRHLHRGRQAAARTVSGS